MSSSSSAFARVYAQFRQDHGGERTEPPEGAELVYDGLWFSPLRKALSTLTDEVNESVTGDIRMDLHGGRATVTGRRSDVALYDFNLATYDSGDTFDQSMARGFIEIFGLSSKVASSRDQRAGA